MATLPEFKTSAPAIQSAGIDGAKDAIRALLKIAPNAGEVTQQVGIPKPKYIVPFTFSTGTLIIPNTDKRFHVVDGKLAVYTDAELLQILQHYQLQVQAGWVPDLE